jgi:hypothetical protein
MFFTWDEDDWLVPELRMQEVYKLHIYSVLLALLQMYPHVKDL